MNRRESGGVSAQITAAVVIPENPKMPPDLQYTEITNTRLDSDPSADGTRKNNKKIAP